MIQKTFSQKLDYTDKLDEEVNSFIKNNIICNIHINISNGWIYETVLYKPK